MASTLAQQLATIANAVGNYQGPIRRGKASLLYDFQQAADVDVQTIYAIALQGRARERTDRLATNNPNCEARFWQSCSRY